MRSRHHQSDVLFDGERHERGAARAARMGRVHHAPDLTDQEEEAAGVIERRIGDGAADARAFGRDLVRALKAAGLAVVRAGAPMERRRIA
jgi:hypothetical protein